MLNSPILNVFARSPIKPMQHHMDKVNDCVKKLIDFMQLAFERKWQESKIIHEEIMLLEAQADELKKEIRLHLPNSLFLPVDRGDLLALLSSQDKIASKAKHIASLVYSRQIYFPDLIAVEFQKFVQRNIDATELAKKAIYELDELVETGFKGREVKVVEDIIFELDKVERDTDDMQVNLQAELFNIEKTLNPIEVIFLYKLIDLTGQLADCAQHVGHRLESLLAQ